MEALKQGLEKWAGNQVEQDALEEPDHLLQKVAENWAMFCLRAHRGDLLNRGLAISAALTAYVDGLVHPETLKD